MNRRLIAVIAALVVVLFSLCLFTKVLVVTRIGTRLYLGARLEITMHIAVDGKAAEIKKASETDETFTISHDDSYTILEARANEEGSFTYKIMVNDIPLTLNFDHTNWWEIVESQLYLDINTEEKTYTISENYFYTQTNNWIFCHRETEKEYPKKYSGIDSITTDVGPGYYSH